MKHICEFVMIIHGFQLLEYIGSSIEFAYIELAPLSQDKYSLDIENAPIVTKHTSRIRAYLHANNSTQLANDFAVEELTDRKARHKYLIVAEQIIIDKLRLHF